MVELFCVKCKQMKNVADDTVTKEKTEGTQHDTHGLSCLWQLKLWTLCRFFGHFLTSIFSVQKWECF